MCATRLVRASAPRAAHVPARTTRRTPCLSSSLARLSVLLSPSAIPISRAAGLAGVWGEIVREWLDDLLPADAAERARGRVTILVLRTLPFPRRVRFSAFESKSDLIDCALASCHIPYFLDGRFSARFRRARWIDGSFLTSRTRDFRHDDGSAPMLYLDPAADPNAPRDFLRLRTPEGVRAMMESGLAYARSPELRPGFAELAAALAYGAPDVGLGGQASNGGK